MKRYYPNVNKQPFMDIDKAVEEEWTKIYLPILQNPLLSQELRYRKIVTNLIKQNVYKTKLYLKQFKIPCKSSKKLQTASLFKNNTAFQKKLLKKIFEKSYILF